MTSPDTSSKPEAMDRAYGKDQTQGRGEEDNAASRASKSPVTHTAGSGTPGYGGASGGTPEAGGLGLPGGAQPLGAGRSGTQDAGEAGTPATGGMGTSGSPGGGSDDNSSDSSPVITFGDTTPYRDNSDEVHRHGHLSVAGGSAGSGSKSTDLDAAANILRDERQEDLASGHPTSGTSAG